MQAKDSIPEFKHFAQLIKMSQNMMRIEFLQFLHFQEMVKIALLNKAANRFVDPNHQYVKTDQDGRIVEKT